jgi:hypothetical protein
MGLMSAGGHYAECHIAECHYTECHGTRKSIQKSWEDFGMKVLEEKILSERFDGKDFGRRDLAVKV